MYLQHTLMESLAKLITHPEYLDKETLYGLREIVAKYPYFQVARLLFLKNLFLLHDPTFGDELRKAALYIPDRRILFKMVEESNYKIQKAPLHLKDCEAKKEGNRTTILIDDFLRSTLGNEEETSSSVTKPHRKPTAADATNDYAAFLMQMDDVTSEEEVEENPSDRSDELINDFIENKPDRIKLQETPLYTPDVNEEKDDGVEDGYLTMTLAKIYIKQQRYEKALEIIRKVNLNNPKKNSYFADQIRFLQKLIANKNHEKA